MKKSLIALAALAAVSAASAQSTVSISGTLDPHFQNQKTTFANGTSRSANTMASGQVGTSNVTFAGTEDLGGGLKALFLYEMDFDTTLSGTGPTAGGQIFAGVQGGFGSVKLGVPNTPSLSTQGARSPFGTKIGGGRTSMELSGGSRTRQSDAIRYDTPNFAGFSAAANYTPKLSALAATQGTQVKLANAIVDVGAFYAAGPIAAGVSRYDQKDVVTHTTAYVSYTIGALKATLGAHSQDNKVAVGDVVGVSTAAGVGKTQGYNVAAAYTIAPAITLLGNIARVNDKTTVDRDLKMAAVGVKYDLSKRTSLNARYISEERENAGATLYVPAKVKTTLVGVQHNF